MLKYYTNRELARKLGLNLARWKRWSREFLPPDPLGGLQSGYARHYNPDEAFSVYLGGHLVGELKFSIPEARQILQDLSQWLLDYGFYFDFSDAARPPGHPSPSVQVYTIFIQATQDASRGKTGFSYIIRGVISDRQRAGKPAAAVREKHYFETLLGPAGEAVEGGEPASCRMINITALRVRFLKNLGLPQGLDGNRSERLIQQGGNFRKPPG